MIECVDGVASNLTTHESRRQGLYEISRGDPARECQLSLSAGESRQDGFDQSVRLDELPLRDGWHPRKRLLIEERSADDAGPNGQDLNTRVFDLDGES